MSYTTALYLRISADDGGADESNSIINQRDLLRGFAAGDPVLSVSEIIEYIDDGWSGANFERPKVKELLDLVRRGGIQCVLVKDLSRWGRNYIEVNEHIEQIFPFLGVRFVSLNDFYDSNECTGRTAPMDIAFTSLVHDLYCKDLSMKVRQSYTAKAKKGEFVQGAAPYGYVKSATEKKMIIDEEAAAVVRHIFALACDGCTMSQIATLLNADKVDSPVMYRKRMGRKVVGYQSMVSEAGVWTETSVRRIITDERFTGVLIFGKTRVISPGGKKIAHLPESEWIKVPGTHKAIVSVAAFKKANAGIRHFKKSGTQRSRVPFIGKIKCGHCGHALRYHPTQTPYFLCQGHSMIFRAGCSDEELYFGELTAVILAVVKVEVGKVLDERQKRSKPVAKHGSDESETAKAESKRLTAQISVLERRSVLLYEDFADGKIDRESYLAAKNACAMKLSAVEASIADLDSRLKKDIGKNEMHDDEPVLRRLLEADEVTEEMLSLISRIIVFDPRRIEIQFAFGDINALGSCI